MKQEETEIALVGRYLDDYFSDNELHNLAVELGIEYENLPASTKDGKAREMVGYMRRHGRLYDLVETCREKRPHVPWPFLVDVVDDDDVANIV